MNKQAFQAAPQYTAISSQSDVQAGNLNMSSLFLLQNEKENQLNFSRRRRNIARVRQRDVERQAYENLRDVVPTLNTTKKPTRVDILKHTCDYINTLKNLLSDLKEEKNLQETNENHQNTGFTVNKE